MADYERDNALAWDLHRREQEQATENNEVQPSQPTAEWTQVRNTRRPPPRSQQDKPPLRSEPNNLPNKTPPKVNPPARSQPQRHSQVRPRRPPPNLALEPDNEAQQAWRNHEPAKDTVNLPTDLILQDDSHIRIARQHGTFILSADEKCSNKSVMTYGIWGDLDAVRATKRELNAWGARCNPSSSTVSRGTNKFAKVMSPTPDLRRRLENRWKRDVKKQCYRQHPPLGKTFGAIGFFHWPVQEYRPEEVLGQSFEALDPVRMDCACYIIFERGTSVFQIMGTIDNVEQASIRLRKGYFQVAARQIAPVRKYLLYWPETTDVPTYVRLESYAYPSTSVDNESRAQNAHVPRSEGLGDYEYPGDVHNSQTAKRIKVLMLQTLEKLQYYRGSIQMRIHLGTFVALRFKTAPNDMYTLEDYENMINQSQFEGKVTDEIGDVAIEDTILHTFQHSTKLLVPEDCQAADLDEVRPVYTAIFTFHDEAGSLCLAISWREILEVSASTTNFDRVSKQWTRFERDSDKAATLLDISMTDLGTGMAWHFGIEGTQVMDESRLPQALVNFADTVTIDPGAALSQRADKLFFNCRPYAAPLKHVQQRISYAYNILSPSGGTTIYTLDLTRFQNCTYPARNTASPQKAQTILHKPRWSLNVHSTDWETKFSQNAGMKIGHGAQWKGNNEPWFPRRLACDGDGDASEEEGFAELMECLKRVAETAMSGNREDLIDGMIVG